MKIAFALALSGLTWMAHGAETIPLDRSMTVSCKKEVLVRNNKTKKLIDATSETLSLGRFWKFKEHEFRLTNFSLNKTQTLTQAILSQVYARILSEGEDHLNYESAVISYSLGYDGKITRGAREGKVFIEKPDPQTELRYEPNESGEKEFVSTRSSQREENNAAIEYFRTEIDPNILTGVGEFQITKSVDICTDTTLPDQIFGRDSGGVFEEMLYRFDGQIVSLRNLDDAAEECRKSRADCTAEIGRTEDQLRRTIDLWQNLTSAETLEKIDLAKQRRADLAKNKTRVKKRVDADIHARTKPEDYFRGGISEQTQRRVDCLKGKTKRGPSLDGCD